MANMNMNMNENTNTNFTVNKVEAGIKPGNVVVYVTYNDNPYKQYNFVRKLYVQNGVGIAVISGYHVKFNPVTYELISIESVYETKGKKVLNSTKLAKKIQEEITTQNIPVPTPQEIMELPSGPVHHEKYEQIKACLTCGLPVYLAGPAGSGKNHTVEQIAEELGWDFYFSNSIQQEYKLTGFIDAGGCFHETEFYKACNSDSDCVFFLDEMDASIPEVLVLLNAAIANGYFEFPNGRVELEHVHFVAAGNTLGSGADEQYTGRMVLDQATLDRFAIIEFDYDKRIEMSITKGNTELVSFIRQLRDKANATGIRATFSYRCMTMVTKLEATGTMTLVDILKISVVKGMDKETIKTLVIDGWGKYHKALKEIQGAA